MGHMQKCLPFNRKIIDSLKIKMRFRTTEMKELTLSKYMYETVALSMQTTNQLPISSVCNAKCMFCSNNMNPFPIYRVGFRQLEDVKKGIALLDPRADEIRLGDSLPGRISEGEALLHPEIWTILRLVRNKAPHNMIQINTNGTMLTKDFVEKLVDFKPLKFTISYHSDNADNWQKIFNLGAKHYKIAYESFYHLSMKGFVIQGAIVPLPRLVGYDDIEKTLKSMKAWTNNIIIYAPGYSYKASSELKEILNVDYKELSLFLAEMRKKFKMQLSFQLDPKSPLRFDPYPLMQRSYATKHQNILWMLSEAAFRRAAKMIRDWNFYFPNEHHIVSVKNFTYRGNISCSGLLMVSDFRKAIKKTLNQLEKDNIKIDLILLPINAFDRFGDDLKGENYSTLEEEFNLHVWLG